MKPLIFGREPAVFATLAAAFINLLSAYFTHWDIATQGLVNAAVLAVAGAYVWFRVAAEKGLAALVAAAQPLMALALAFGLHITAEQQSSLLLFLNMVLAFWLRGQVVAPVDPFGERVSTEGHLEDPPALPDLPANYYEGEKP